MTGIEYRMLADPTAEIAVTIERWENDRDLVPFIRPCKSREDWETKTVITVDTLRKRLLTNHLFLIYAEGVLVGEVSYQIDPPQCYRKINGSAWIGINIGEKRARHRGIGSDAMLFVENHIEARGLKRIELGVFEFNENARRLYLKLGYREIGRIDNFTYWNERMWQDIRMEKLLNSTHSGHVRSIVTGDE